MRLIQNDQQKAVLDHLRALFEEQRRDVNIIYSELKLRLPTYLKSVTIQELRSAGVAVEPDISITSAATGRIIKFRRLKDKFREIEEWLKTQVMQYYVDLKKELPKELLDKQLQDLNEEEWARLTSTLL